MLKIIESERVTLLTWYNKANSVQEACIKCLVVHTLEFRFLKPCKTKQKKPRKEIEMTICIEKL